MTHVLFVGQEPQTVDFSDPALPPGTDAAKIQTGIDLAMSQMSERGWQADACMITPDDAGLRTLQAQLVSHAYDCVVIGGGLRLPPKGLALFESVINAVHQHAPGAAIAFNTKPEDSADAVARRLQAG